jgi:fumarate reductase iron-sulfur subunit
MEDKTNVTLKILRFNPSVDRRPFDRQYEIPWTEGLSVLEAVRYVHRVLDPTLAFNDYYCGRGLCQGCLLEIDGKTQRSCHYLLRKDSSPVVGPPAGFPVIRDIRVDFGVPVKLGPGNEILWFKDGARIEAESKALR